MGVLLVVFEKDIEDRLVLLDEIRFKRESFDLVIGDDEVDVGYASDEIAGPELLRAVGMKVLADTIAKILRFADIDYLGLPVPEEIAAGLCRQIG